MNDPLYKCSTVQLEQKSYFRALCHNPMNELQVDSNESDLIHLTKDV